MNNHNIEAPKTQNKNLAESDYDFLKRQNSQQTKIVQLNRITEDQQKQKSESNQRIISCVLSRSPILRTQIKDVFTDVGIETFGRFKHNRKSLKSPKNRLFYKKNIKCQKLKKFLQERFAKEISLEMMKNKNVDPSTFLFELLNNGQQLVSKKDYIALDCEMVGGSKGTPNLLARVSIVDYYGKLLIDSLVKPKGEIKDYRTWITGITKKTLINAPTFEEVQKEILKIVKNKTIIGHDIDNDLKALGIKDIINNNTFDTLEIPVYCKTKDAVKSLKGIIYNLFGLTIQNGVHSSIIDSMATMAAFRFVEPVWFNNEALKELEEILDGDENI